MDHRGTIVGLCGAPRALIGMIHVGALPGTPACADPLERLVEVAVVEARAYREAGYDALMIENMHDRPYLNASVGPEIVAAMTVVGREVRSAVRLPLGVQILAGANLAALAVAHAVGAAFVRVEGFVFAHVADEGLIESSAGALTRYRRAIGATGVRIFADVKKKHAAHALTADVSLAETAVAAEFFLADGVIVTGPTTGRAADPAEVESVAHAVGVPVLVGSGVTAENLAAFTDADAFIVGSSVKRDGHWASPLDPDRAAAVARAFHALPPR
jgi:membrane complex biogenesis BtpA family protein